MGEKKVNSDINDIKQLVLLQGTNDPYSILFVVVHGSVVMGEFPMILRKALQTDPQNVFFVFFFPRFGVFFIYCLSSSASHSVKWRPIFSK
jgi:hypothetical protein